MAVSTISSAEVPYISSSVSQNLNWDSTWEESKVLKPGHIPIVCQNIFHVSAGGNSCRSNFIAMGSSSAVRFKEFLDVNFKIK